MLPVSVPALTVPPPSSVMLPVARVRVPVTDTAPLMVSAVGPSLRLKSVALKAPRSWTAFGLVLSATAPIELPVSVPAAIVPPTASVIVPAVRLSVFSTFTAPAIASGLPPLLRVKSVAAKSPSLVTLFELRASDTAPVELPVSVPAVILPPTVSVMLAALRVNVPGTETRPSILSAVVPSLRLKFPVVTAKAPRSPIAFVLVSFTSPTEVAPVNLLATIEPPVSSVMLPASRVRTPGTVTVPLTFSAVVPSLRLKLPTPPTVKVPRSPTALAFASNISAPEWPVSVATVIVPPGFSVILPAAMRFSVPVAPPTASGPSRATLLPELSVSALNPGWLVTVPTAMSLPAPCVASVSPPPAVILPSEVSLTARPGATAPPTFMPSPVAVIVVAPVPLLSVPATLNAAPVTDSDNAPPPVATLPVTASAVASVRLKLPEFVKLPRLVIWFASSRLAPPVEVPVSVVAVIVALPVWLIVAPALSATLAPVIVPLV